MPSSAWLQTPHKGEQEFIKLESSDIMISFAPVSDDARRWPSLGI